MTEPSLSRDRATVRTQMVRRRLDPTLMFDQRISLSMVEAADAHRA
jgi:hypothetical protein